MRSPLLPLLESAFRSWISAKGFALVVASAVLPVVLTGAWVLTHQADIQGVSIRKDVPFPEEGDMVNFTGIVRNSGKEWVGAFNASLIVLKYEGGVFTSSPIAGGATSTKSIERLGPGETAQLNLTWRARPGIYIAIVAADTSEDIQEIDEFNNLAVLTNGTLEGAPFVVSYRNPSPTDAPNPPSGIEGSSNSTNRVPLSVVNLSGPPRGEAGRTLEFEATFRNSGSAPVEKVTLVLRVGRSSSGFFLPLSGADTTLTNVTIPPGENRTVHLSWNSREGAYWVEAFALPPEGSSFEDPSEAHLSQPVVVDPSLPSDLGKKVKDALQPYLEPPPKATIKGFYLEILSLLHLRILVPFIALFYAGGVLLDEREKGHLPYLLSRPLPRTLIPSTRFLAGFLVALVALIVGVLATYVLLFGTTPQGRDVGFFTTPLLGTLLALFAYGGVFTFLGVIVARPYLVGIAFVLGWETAANLLLPWVRELTLTEHIGRALREWPLDQGVLLLPPDPSAQMEVLYVLGAGVAGLLLSGWAMKNVESDR